MKPNAVPAPWREIGWAVLILVSAILVAVIFAVTCLVILRFAGWRAAFRSPTLDYLLFAIAGQITCVWMTIARTRKMGGDDVCRSLAAGPSKRSLLFLVLMALETIAIVRYGTLEFISPEYAHNRSQEWQELLIAATKEGPFLLIAYVFQNIIMAPISEEMMFRGWLWTALRRSWGAWPTAVCTSVLWLIPHLGYGMRGIFHLLPMAVQFSLVRYYTDSIRATILLHGLHNARIAILTLLPLYIA